MPTTARSASPLRRAARTSSRRQLMGLLLAASSLSALMLPLQAHAQSNYPNRPLKFIVPWPAGGSADIAGRLYADFLSKELGQPVVVENRPGAGANLGVGVLAKSAPDGYTLGQVSIGTQSINQFIYPSLGYDPHASFEHIGLQTRQPNILLVKKDSPFKTLQELVAYAKANPGKLNYASPGIGSSLHLTGAYLSSQAGFQWTHVPFKGAAESIPALIGGQVDVVFDNMSSALQHVKDGTKVRALVVTTMERVNEVPEVPALRETGVLKDPIYSWFGIAAPKGIPAEALQRLNAASANIFKHPEYVAKLKAFAAEPGALQGEDYLKFQASERNRWQQVVKDNQISIKN